jgi:hypothetical protein
MNRTPLGSLAVGLLVILAVGCKRPPAGTASGQAVIPEYDKTGRLTLLTYDRDGNGQVDTWGYMDGARVVRVEVDEDGDGRIDRWEYHRSGTACEGAGCGDGARGGAGQAVSSTPEAPDKTVERIERATRHDGRISRREFFEHGALMKIEEDTDGDGKLDKWETYSDGSLSSLAFDSQGRGRPDRRLIYRPDGTVSRIEADPNGTGKFEPVTP